MFAAFVTNPVDRVYSRNLRKTLNGFGRVLSRPRRTQRISLMASSSLAPTNAVLASRQVLIESDAGSVTFLLAFGVPPSLS